MYTILLASEGCDPWAVRVEDFGELRTWARERLASFDAVAEYVAEVADPDMSDSAYAKAWSDGMAGEWLAGEFSGWQVIEVRAGKSLRSAKESPLTRNADGKVEWVHTDGDLYVVTGVDRWGTRLKPMRYKSWHHVAMINLWQGSKWLERDGRRYLIQRVYN